MTFSIVAFDILNKEWGVAVQSKFVAVSTVIPFAKANIVAFASQAYCNTSFRPKDLTLLELFFTAQEIIDPLLKNGEFLCSISLYSAAAETTTRKIDNIQY